MPDRRLARRGRRNPHGFNIAPQHPHTERMEGRDDWLGNAQSADKFFDALAHFRSGLVGERHRQNGLRHYPLVLDQIGDAKRDDARLPAAGAGEDQHGSFSSFDGFALLRIELVEKRQNGSGSRVASSILQGNSRTRNCSLQFRSSNSLNIASVAAQRTLAAHQFCPQARGCRPFFPRNGTDNSLTASSFADEAKHRHGVSRKWDAMSAFGGTSMSRTIFLASTVLLTMAALVIADHQDARAGEVSPASGYKVLEPIAHGNLTVFPVVASKSYPTGEFLTLDEGLRSGEVVVTEAGNVQGLIRRHPGPAIRHDGAQVNRLVLVNNSKRPLLLLAGEIVSGGKQDRVIGKDRIVPAESDPVDLSVFCVEPGRWVATSEHFGPSESMYGGKTYRGSAAPMAMMAQPSVRGKAMADKNQNEVWDAVNKQKEAMTVEVIAAAPEVATEMAHTTSYAKVNENEVVKQQVDTVAKPIEQNYESLIHQLRDRNAVGVVVAVNGRIIWADVFASTDLLEKYWPKLVRSYASEAVVTRAKEVDVTVSRAQAFLSDMEGRRETIESEPGIYRHTEVTGDGFKAFSLTSLLPKTGFEVHVAKMPE